MEKFFVAAFAAVEALRKAGHECYVFGSTAFAAYEMTNRIPHNVDIAVLGGDNESAGDVISGLLLGSEHFALQKFSQGGKLYEVLYFRVPGACQLHEASVCTVNITVVGKGPFYLPPIPSGCIVWWRGIPFPPLKTLILHRLHGWYAHRTSRSEVMQAKAPQYEEDIMDTLRFVHHHHADLKACAGGVAYWCPKDLHKCARTWVRAYMEAKVVSFVGWYFLGFNVYLALVTRDGAPHFIIAAK